MKSHILIEIIKIGRELIYKNLIRGNLYQFVAGFCLTRSVSSNKQQTADDKSNYGNDRYIFILFRHNFLLGLKSGRANGKSKREE